jgi:cbb3-type cytochrome oxidase subunit 1
VLLTLIFGVLGVIVILGGFGLDRERNNPMMRVGAWFFGAALVLIALVFLLAEI